MIIGLNNKGAFVLVHHDFEDFYREVELNADDPAWKQRVVEVTITGYANKKKGVKAEKKPTLSTATFDLDNANGRGRGPVLQAL